MPHAPAFWEPVLSLSVVHQGTDELVPASEEVPVLGHLPASFMSATGAQYQSFPAAPHFALNQPANQPTNPMGHGD